MLRDFLRRVMNVFKRLPLIVARVLVGESRTIGG